MKKTDKQELKEAKATIKQLKKDNRWYVKKINGLEHDKNVVLKDISRLAKELENEKDNVRKAWRQEADSRSETCNLERGIIGLVKKLK